MPTNLLALRSQAYREAAQNQAAASPKSLALTARVLSMLSDHTHERYAVMTWLLGDHDLTEGDVVAVLRLFPIQTNDEIVQSRALFADILAQTRVPA